MESGAWTASNQVANPQAGAKQLLLSATRLVHSTSGASIHVFSDLCLCMRVMKANTRLTARCRRAPLQKCHTSGWRQLLTRCLQTATCGDLPHMQPWTASPVRTQRRPQGPAQQPQQGADTGEGKARLGRAILHSESACNTPINARLRRSMQALAKLPSRLQPFTAAARAPRATRRWVCDADPRQCGLQGWWWWQRRRRCAAWLPLHRSATLLAVARTVDRAAAADSNLAPSAHIHSLPAFPATPRPQGGSHGGGGC